LSSAEKRDILVITPQGYARSNAGSRLVSAAQRFVKAGKGNRLAL